MARVAFPSRCAVAVVCGEHLVSQVYPASVPIDVFMDDIVELINADLKRRGVTAFEPGVSYELHRANGMRLDIAKTLDELGVEDGSTLMLVPAEEGIRLSRNTSRCPPGSPGSARSCSRP